MTMSSIIGAIGLIMLIVYVIELTFLRMEIDKKNQKYDEMVENLNDIAEWFGSDEGK